MIYKKATLWNAMHITVMWDKMMVETGEEREDLSRERFFLDLICKIKSPEWYVLIATDNDHPIGFIIGHMEYMDFTTYVTGNCLYLYVDKDYRGQGISDKLIEYLHTWFKENKAKNEEFITNYDEKLLKVWKRKGYEPKKIIFGKEVQDGKE